MSQARGSKRTRAAEKEIAELWIAYAQQAAERKTVDDSIARLWGAVIILAGVSCCVVSWLACRG